MFTLFRTIAAAARSWPNRRVARPASAERILGRYSPTNDARDGTYRHITLEIDAPDGPVVLMHRKGYFAPIE